VAVAFEKKIFFTLTDEELGQHQNSASLENSVTKHIVAQDTK